MRIAIIGSGISGLLCAHVLQTHHDVVLFESADRLGGHTNTVRVELPDASSASPEIYEVDTGFLVHNDRNYPGLIRLFDELGVATQPSEMSFSMRDERSGVEWRGTSLRTVLAQPFNALRPDFVRMLIDVVRFNRLARGLLDGPADREFTLADLLARHRFGRRFRDWYLVPLGSAIWSADPSSFLGFPAATFARFFANHGLLGLRGQPRWRTVTGGSRRYVDAIAAELGDRVRVSSGVDKIVRHDDHVEVHGGGRGSERFDQVIVATHSDQALALLSDPTPAEREILGAIRYQPNVATLHTDETMLPRTIAARASWNYHVGTGETRRCAVTYDVSRLQALGSSVPILVTLNRADDIDPARVICHIDYAHPVFDAAAVGAQARIAEINGQGRTWFAGAYWGYGFHEDGVRSAQAVCGGLGVEW